MAEHGDSVLPTQPSDYDRIGAAPAVSRVVHRFYELVLADEQLAPFFKDADLTRLKRHQVLLIAQVLGGPADYPGRELKVAHAGMQISTADYRRVEGHLAAALREAEVPPDIIGRVAEVLAVVEDDVVTAAAN
ncbi:MAG: group 1 truncated hemoglobin [Propionibacteriales bacterium]|nr:group 1 truncated hemoglobin [Propionibacteriales bacterium]